MPIFFLIFFNIIFKTVIAVIHVRAILTRNTSSFAKKLHVADLLQNGHFVRVSNWEMIDHQYRKETYLQTIIELKLIVDAVQINKNNYLIENLTEQSVKL